MEISDRRELDNLIAFSKSFRPNDLEPVIIINKNRILKDSILHQDRIIFYLMLHNAMRT